MGWVVGKCGALTGPIAIWTSDSRAATALQVITAVAMATIKCLIGHFLLSLDQRARVGGVSHGILGAWDSRRLSRFHINTEARNAIPQCQ